MEQTAVIFPGQGSQRVGMGKDFYDNFSQAKETFQEASSAIDQDMAALCFSEDPRLDQTEFTQPAILCVEIAMLRVLQKEFGFAPSLFAGHSLGEYSALVAAEVIPFADAMRLVRKRGALMQQAVPHGRGAMAAIIKEHVMQSESEKIILSCHAEIANYNSEDQVVISGEKDAVEKASQRIAAEIEGARVVPLNVSAPFHSSLMKEIEPEFLTYLQNFSTGFNFKNITSVISNFSGGFHTQADFIQNLIHQISGSVRWLHNMKALHIAAQTIVEVGPNRVLSKFFASLAGEPISVPSIINLRAAEKLFKN